MWFYRFIKACRKYRFTFALSSYQEYLLVLRPNNTFENIEVRSKHGNYKKMFKNSIKIMKEYRR